MSELKLYEVSEEYISYISTVEKLAIPRFRGKIRHQGRMDWMVMEPALYQLMGIRMNSVMNGITNLDGVYQAIIRKSDEYSNKLVKGGSGYSVR